MDDAYKTHLETILPEYTFIIGNGAEFLEQTRETYDIIFMSHVFEHLPRDLADRTISGMYQKLKPE